MQSVSRLLLTIPPGLIKLSLENLKDLLCSMYP